MLRFTKKNAHVSNLTTVKDDVAGKPAVEIAAAGVILTNEDGGRVIAETSGHPAIAFTVGGSTVINELGGIIRTDDYSGVAISGSSGADTVINNGSIQGSVSLGEGADRYEVHNNLYYTPVQLGGGDDVGLIGADWSQTMDGGSGVDKLILSEAVSQVYGDGVTGFEQLQVDSHGANGTGGTNINIVNFSGYSSITLAAGGFDCFIDCVNPNVDLAVQQARISVQASSQFRDVVGTAGSEGVEMMSGRLRNVDLGAGDDSFVFNQYSIDVPFPQISGTVKGGSGTDYLNISVAGGTVDLSKFSGFEVINTGTFTSATSNVRLLHANGYQQIISDSGGPLTLASSNSPNAVLQTAQGTVITLDSATTIGRVGDDPFWLADSGQGDDRQSFSIVNQGTILGDVHLYIGDDSYDGRLGSEGGAVYGYAGNDTIYLGSGNDTAYGGYGIDKIDGGAGNDLIDGGSGIDTMSGGLGNDTFYVDNAKDVVLEAKGAGDDKMFASVSYALAEQYVETLTLTGTANLSAKGNSQANTLIGNDGNNVLDGGAGADSMYGGKGDDTYYVDRNGDKAVEATGGGTDHVISSISYSLAGQQVENLTLAGTAAINATGNSLANTLVGNAAANILNGGAGADSMTGGKGDDIFYVDNAGDKVFEAYNQGSDRILSSVSFALDDQYVEALTLTGTAAINASGNNRSNSLVGNLATNVLSGRDGNDSLDGGGGKDLLSGGAGADKFLFSTALDAKSNWDDILDFSVKDDTILLNKTIFGAAGPDGALSSAAFFNGSAAHDADDRIVYDKASGNIFYDADGSGHGVAMLFAHVDPGTALTNADFSVYTG